jgi:hypothetical protein
MQRPSISRREYLGAGAAGLAATLAGCSAPGLETTVHSTETISVDSGTELTVQNQQGLVDVAGWTDDAVELDVTRRTTLDRSALQRATVESAVDDGVLSVESQFEDRRARNRVTVDIRIRVPGDVSVRALQTANGDVQARDVTGDADLLTRNGNVSARNVDGFPRLESTNGNVTAENTAGLDRARTLNGNVNVEVRRIRSETLAASTNGSVTLSVPPTLDADVVLTVGNGNVTVADVSLSNERRIATRVTGRLGDGGPRLEGRTVNGDVTLQGLE